MPDTHHAYEHVKGIYVPNAIGVFALVAGTLLILLVRGARRTRPGQRSHALGLEIVYAAVLACVATLLVVVTFRTETPIDRAVAHPALRIKVVAAQWSWRLVYPGGLTLSAISSWNPPVALVPAGVEVEFAGISRDVIHGFWVPRLYFMRQLLPGHVTRFDLRFGREGAYPGECSVFCGDQHTQMHFMLRAVAPAAFQRWLATGGREA